MAQKREKEETELKVPETLICTAPMPVPPNPSAADDSALKSSKPPEISDPPPDPSIRTRSTSATSPGGTDLTRAPHALRTAEVKRREVNRCASCRRKVGLTGFRCRCGDLFCTEHRYSDRHDCSYDYKAAGREAIARENPVVRPTKILKV